jgi:hypothetical protein
MGQPVLVEGASMPSPEDMTDSPKKLARANRSSRRLQNAALIDTVIA